MHWNSQSFFKFLHWLYVVGELALLEWEDQENASKENILKVSQGHV